MPLDRIPGRDDVFRDLRHRARTFAGRAKHPLSLQSTAGSNGDGFGLGWYGEHPEPGLYRETRPAWSDENLRYLCRHLRSHLFVAHVRAATGTAVMRQNCHLFACGCWMLMHNGFVGAGIGCGAEALIPDAYYPSRLGTTDSEAAFLAMMGTGLEGEPLRATRRVLQALVGLVCLTRHIYLRPHLSKEVTVIERAIAVENKRRAQRYGTDCIFASKDGPVTISEMLSRIIDDTAEDADALGCAAEIEHCRIIVDRGSSAEFQLRAYRENGDDIAAVS